MGTAAERRLSMVLTAFVKFGDGRISTETDVETLRAAGRDTEAIFWLDLNKPTEEELGLLDACRFAACIRRPVPLPPGSSS